MTPKISVVMSVYNGEKFLKEAIDSVLNQNFKDFEFIIINDGSKDGSLSIINSYDDKRIKLIDNGVNKGLIYSLNKGFDEAKGKYIVRFDADDICLKDRFQIQYDYMEKNPDVAMMSAYATWFFDGCSFISNTIRSQKEYEDIKAKFIFENHINHSCVILRNDIVEKEKYRYDKKYLHIEDYGLWLEISKKYKVTTLDKVLLKCRISRTSVTSTANRDMRARQQIYNIIYDEIYGLIGYKPEVEDYEKHFEISMIQNLKNSRFTLEEKVQYLKKLLAANNEKFVDNEKLKEEIAYQIYKNAVYSSTYKDYKSIDFYNFNNRQYIKWTVTKGKFSVKKIIKKLVR